MVIAVAGATGLVGRPLVKAIEKTGHEAVPVSRSHGVDLISGDGLDSALRGVDAVVDVTNTMVADPDRAREFFGTTTRNLLEAEERAGVEHHVVLSIVGLDRVQGNGHYAGKRRQEELARAGRVPATVLRATMFHDFGAMVAGWTRRDGVATVAPLLIQPVAVADVARALAQVAVLPPGEPTIDLAGPEPQDLVDMARRTLEARGELVRVVASWRDGPFGIDMAGEVLLPGPDARIAPTTFESWLESQRSSCLSA